MKKIIIILSIILAGALYFSSCEVDNYPPPDMTLKGNVVDQVTGENIQTRQPLGIKIRLMEEGYPTPYEFWAMSDGSFLNTKLFSANYEVTVMEGPFEDESVETLHVDLHQNRDITFQVMPYTRLKNVNVSNSGATITATYDIEITTRDVLSSELICHGSVHLHEATIGVKRSEINDLREMTDDQITSTTFTDQITGLTSGTYYARVAVLTENALNRYNYSPIVKIVIP